MDHADLCASPCPQLWRILNAWQLKLICIVTDSWVHIVCIRIAGYGVQDTFGIGILFFSNSDNLTALTNGKKGT